MKATWLLTLGVILLAGAVAAQFHDPVYVTGGYYPAIGHYYAPGTFLLDMHGAPVLTRIYQPGCNSRGFCMDHDNKQVVFAVRWSCTASTINQHLKGGLFRYDPATSTVSTIFAESTSTHNYDLFDVVLDQEGDYLVNGSEYDKSSSAHTGHRLWRIDRSGKVTTVATTLSIGRWSIWNRQIAVNIDSGKVLVNDSWMTPGWHRGILEIDPEDGTIGTWSTGGAYGWEGTYNMPQNHLNGYLEGPYGGSVLQLKPGTSTQTTLAILDGKIPCAMFGGAAFDLQTAARPRMVVTTYKYYSNGGEGWHYFLDASTWTPTVTRILPSQRFYSYDLDFYRGRHTQTVSAGPRKWKILFSAPRFGGKPYVAAAGFSGVRPGIGLPDGRRINLNFDSLVVMTLFNAIPSVFKAGGYLDAGGEATGTLDLSGIAKLGMPLWIVWMVLDPAAPGGVAYIPDTYVMRV